LESRRWWRLQKITDVGEVRVSATAANSLFTVTVTDTGPYIPEEHQMRIFEQFHQVDSSNTMAKGGAGLGLAIAKEIVEMHGGLGNVSAWQKLDHSDGSADPRRVPQGDRIMKRVAVSSRASRNSH
jgi:signal transduction histidine kinase